MMSSPNHYKETNSELTSEVIRRFSFATIITSSLNGPFVSHLPLLLEDERTLLGHCARANPQWRHFAEGQSVTSIFHGPHAYISPAWYQPKSANVPTWNYVVIHTRGKATLVEDPQEVFAAMTKIVNHFEAAYETGWSLPAEMNGDLAALHKAIVVFRIKIENIEAKFKLSQKQDSVDRETVIRELPKNQGHEGQLVAEFMGKVKPAGIQKP
jgi:transcriptional regulator